MKSICKFLVIALAAAGGVAPRACTAAPRPEMTKLLDLHWEALPPLPDREGFAAPFAGTSGGALLVAGGANFPDQRPWDGGMKTWYDAIYRLDQPAGTWNQAGRLPRPIAYGISVSTHEGVVCIGGGDARQHFADVFRLELSDGQVRAVTLPSLPRARAFASGALVGDTVYVVGGLERPDATRCADTIWALDLGQPSPRWQAVPACPDPERMLAVAGAAEGSLFLFSGTRLSPDAQGKPVREYLRDAWRYTPGRGWRRLADMPRAAVAAASPAPLVPGARLLVISGDDGTKLGFKPETAHPGFPRDVLAYQVALDCWSVLGDAPFSRATVPTAVWGSRLVIPNGEARPGYRSPEVWALASPAAGP
jgi:N-acetylneuraminate epimerase